MNTLKLFKLFAAVTSAVIFSSSSSAQTLFQSDINDGGGNLSNAANSGITATNTAAGTLGGKWNFGSYLVSDRSVDSATVGVLNMGYTNFYKTTDVDLNASGTNNLSRKFVFTDGTPGTYTGGDYDNARAVVASDLGGDYTIEMNIRRYDLRRNWDTSAASAAQKGIMFRVIGNNGNETMTAYTSGTNGFRIAGQLSGATSNAGAVVPGTSYKQVNGGAFTGESVGRYEADGITMRFTGNLGTGLFSMFAKDNKASEFTLVQTGAGLTEIKSIAFAANSPVAGSWGGSYVDEATNGAGGDPSVNGNVGDYAWINSISMTAVPEPSSHALIAGCLAMTAIMLRRRF